MVRQLWRQTPLAFTSSLPILATRDHAARLEVVTGGLTAGVPLTGRAVSIP